MNRYHEVYMSRKVGPPLDTLSRSHPTWSTDYGTAARFLGAKTPHHVVRQLVGTTLGGLRHLVWTTFAPAERDHLVGGLPGSVS